MQQLRKFMVILLTALFAVPAYVSMTFAEVKEANDSKAYLIMALPGTVPISQLDSSAIIDLRSKEAFSANPIKGASNMSYDEALKTVESGKLDNRALLFVYTDSPKATYGQDLESTDGMETYQRQGRVGPIRRLISFVMSLFGLSPENGSEEGIEDTPGYGPIEGTEGEAIGGIAGEEFGAPTPPAIEEEANEWVGDPTPPVEEATMIGENNSGLLPPLEEITPPVNEEDNTSLSEEEGSNDTVDNAEDSSEISDEEEFAVNPLVDENMNPGSEEMEDNPMPIAGNPETEDMLTGIGADNDETIIAAQPIDPRIDGNLGETEGTEEDTKESAQQTMSVEALTKALNQRGHNLTVIPFN